MGTSQQFKITIPGKLKYFELIYFFVDYLCNVAQLTTDETTGIEVAIEEAITNIVKHGYKYSSNNSQGTITLTVMLNLESIIFELLDVADEFNPLTVPEPTMYKKITHRQVGGLGIHLIRYYMDELKYERTSLGENKFTLIKEFNRF